MRVRIGCCGFSVAHERYYQAFSLVELQSTFYKPPREFTLQRWRKEAPPGFELVVKAWQVITHPSSSPTWKRAGLSIGKAKTARYGYMRPTTENVEALERTLGMCDVLQAHICLIQCPPSFQPTAENVRNVKRLLSQMEGRGVTIAWEPRGTWLAQPMLIAKLCDELGLIHVVDLLRHGPASSVSLVYSRLHGLGNREVNYTYRYTESDLQKLALKLAGLEKNGCQEAYVLFNNIGMFENAKRFAQLLSANL